MKGRAFSSSTWAQGLILGYEVLRTDADSESRDAFAVWFSDVLPSGHGKMGQVLFAYVEGFHAYGQRS